MITSIFESDLPWYIVPKETSCGFAKALKLPVSGSNFIVKSKGGYTVST